MAISLFADVKISENTSKQAVFSENLPPGHQHKVEKQKKEAEKFAVTE